MRVFHDQTNTLHLKAVEHEVMNHTMESKQEEVVDTGYDGQERGACEICNALRSVPYLLGRRKRPDGSGFFGNPFGIEVKFCPTCGKELKP